MLKQITILILLLILTLYSSDRETVTYCSISDGYDIKLFNGVLYAGTDGGLITGTISSNRIYDIDDDIYKAQISAVEMDHRGMIWLGHPDCTVSVFDPETKKVKFINDIQVYGVYELNTIYASDKYIYIATNGLLSRYRYNSDFDKYDVADTNQMTGSVTNVAVSKGILYISTESGIFSINEDDSNIGFMDKWEQLTGLDAGTVINDIVITPQSCIALTNNGLYTLKQNSAVKEDSLNGENLFRGLFLDNYLYISMYQTDATVYVKLNSDLTGEPDLFFGLESVKLTNFALDSDNIYYTSSTGFSYSPLNDPDTRYDMTFNIPKEKGINKLYLDTGNNILHYSTERNISFFDNGNSSFCDSMFKGTYKNSTELITKILFSNSRLYVCTWGEGVNVFTFNDGTYEYEQNYNFGTAIPDIDYAVHTGIDSDLNGNIWISSWHGSNVSSDKTINCLKTNNEIISYKVDNFNYINSIYIDDNDWIWMGSSSQLFGEIDGLGITKADEISIKKIEGLGGIIDVVKDKKDFIWIATNNGIKFIDLNTVSSFSSLNAGNVEQVNSGPVGNFIYDIEVSTSNEKWFATDKGVSVLSSDNSEWKHFIPLSSTAQFNLPGIVYKTKMIDETVLDIALDEKNGNVIFSSYNGITFLEYGGIVVDDKVPSGDIYTKPSPFLNDGSDDNSMSFIFPSDGNIYNTAKIFDLTGRLIKGEFDISNGWNGRDNKNKIVSTGVYQVIAYNKNDKSKKIKGKIAVVRK